MNYHISVHKSIVVAEHFFSGGIQLQLHTY